MAAKRIYEGPAWPGGIDEASVELEDDGSVRINLPWDWDGWTFTPEVWRQIVEATRSVWDPVGGDSDLEPIASNDYDDPIAPAPTTSPFMTDARAREWRTMKGH